MDLIFHGPGVRAQPYIFPGWHLKPGCEPVQPLTFDRFYSEAIMKYDQGWWADREDTFRALPGHVS
ncbi:MAG: hypothetical protein ACI80V_003111 [Rhodothermales bacterium]|jgi:hypothetical protein